MRLDERVDLATLNTRFESLESQGVEHLEADGFARDDISISRSTEMRYVGQIHECSVELETGTLTPEKIEALLAAFHRRHEELYTYAEPHNPVELVNIESTLTGHVSKPPVRQLTARGCTIKDALTEHRPMLFDGEGLWVETPVYSGERLDPGIAIEGPAVVEEPTTNIVVRPGWTLVLEPNNCYRITRQG
ncbi:hypothetical protein [Marinobacterium aestuariivivens]|uniref:Acetophenone carboxylase-like C-terminal domain-containing protein n=1 Tax=Marinobacterium aestuariivivens TaxID=1698799 RepID=A0ABW2A495_9GAMM